MRSADHSTNSMPIRGDERRRTRPRLLRTRFTRRARKPAYLQARRHKIGYRALRMGAPRRQSPDPVSRTEQLARGSRQERDRLRAIVALRRSAGCVRETAARASILALQIRVGDRLSEMHQLVRVHRGQSRNFAVKTAGKLAEFAALCERLNKVTGPHYRQWRDEACRWRRLAQVRHVFHEFSVVR
jgi:hypothetical protein